MFDFIINPFINWLYLPFLSFVKLLEENPNNLYVLIVIFIILNIIKSKIDKANSKIDLTKSKIYVRILPKLVNFLGIATLILIFILAYHQFSPAVADFLKPSDPSQTPSTTTPASETKTNTQSAPAQQTTPSYQAPKQMYYSISCYNCWAESCPRNGYNYSGYDSYYYTYYTALCRSCSCNSLNGQSFWK